ncbi:hypothetical protein Xoosp14_51 [Xanthomonas phage Xoo-sp14]|nr:hypothetical protein Xoosp14_51 [Xanthomonas phage Xoo-sp14]
MTKKAIEKKNVAATENTAEYYELIAERKRLVKRVKALKDAGRSVPDRLRHRIAELKRLTNKSSIHPSTKSRSKVQEILTKGAKPSPETIKKVTVASTTSIADLAKELGMRPSGLVSRLFRHGTTAVSADQLGSVKGIVKILNVIGEKEGFEVKLDDNLAAVNRLVGAFDVATRDRRVKPVEKELTPIAISPRAQINDLAEKLGIKNGTLVKHYFAMGKPVSISQTVASGGRRRAQEIAKTLGFQLTFLTKGKAAKKVSQVAGGLTLRQLEEEIFKVDSIRVIFRASPSQRSGVKQWIQKMPENSTISDLCKRLRNANSELAEIALTLIDGDGNSYSSSANQRQRLDYLTF